VGIWDWDIVTNRRYWSPRFKEMMGIEDETLVPTFEEFYSRLHPADREHTVFAIKRHLEYRDPFSVEFRLRRSNGDYIWVDATGQATWDASGKPIRMVGAAGDITTRKTAERELGESRSRYKAVIDSTPDGLITTDSRGIVQSFNLSAERILGYRGSEVIGRDVQLLMHEPFISSRHTDVAHGLKAGEAHIVGVGREVSGIRKDGTQIPMDLTVSAFRVGNEPGFIGIIRDVTARKLVENDAALLLSSIVASSDDGIISESLSGFITSWNTSAEKMFGFTSRQAIGQTIRIIIPPEKREEEEMILGRINRGEEVKHIETVRMGMNGERLSVSLTVSPVRDLTGRLIGASKILRDITQRKEEEAERLKAESMLRAIVDQAVDGLITIDSRGIVESYNPACCRIFGYASDEVIGRNIKMLMPEPYHSSHDGYISRYEASGEARIIGTLGREVTGQRKDGSIFSMDLSISALTLGTERHYSGLVRDNSERNRQELALRKSEDFLDRTGRLASVGGWELDLVTNKVNWSEETRRLLGVETGFTPTLEKGLNFYAPEARPIIAGAIEQALVDGKDWEVVVPMIQANGSKIWARVTATVQFEDGKPVRLVGALQDVSARVAEQEALSEANTRVALATESCGIGIWDWDLRSDRFICDKMVHKIFGLEPEGDKLFSLAYWAGRVHPNDRASVEEALQDCLNGVRPYNLDFRTVWDDGSVHHIKATGKLICNPNGVATRMVGTNMDITAGKLAEEELRNQADLLNLSHDSIMVRDFDGTIRFWNDGAQEMYGFSKADAIGSVSHDLLQTVFPRPLAEIEAELTRNKRWDGQLGHTTRDGVKVFVESRWVLQQIGGGTALRVLEINNDITERKNAEEASLRHVETLTRSNQELDAFAYAASHDLKAPLRVIQNASQWIEEDLEQHLTGESRENMDLLRSRVKRMDKLLDDLLQYSRIGRGTDKGQNEVISGAALMDNIRELLAPPPEFVVDMSSGFAGIEVYRMPLQQVLINLISNALKHHDKEAGRIEVGVEDLGSMFRFSVKDDGPGIPPQYHEQIFKMFQTLKPRDQVEGSGMGLAMVRKHIDIAGGTLHLESSVGHGSTFIFTWPKHIVGVKLADTEFATTGETR
jgi:PAS domain S-box-containing protein